MWNQEHLGSTEHTIGRKDAWPNFVGIIEGGNGWEEGRCWRWETSLLLPTDLVVGFTAPQIIYFLCSKNFDTRLKVLLMLDCSTRGMVGNFLIG